jgi:hypothetical protein
MSKVSNVLHFSKIKTIDKSCINQQKSILSTFVALIWIIKNIIIIQIIIMKRSVKLVNN